MPMNDQNFKDLARKARECYRVMHLLQKILNDMFFEEFCRLDEEEEKEKLLSFSNTPPF